MATLIVTIRFVNEMLHTERQKSAQIVEKHLTPNEISGITFLRTFANKLYRKARHVVPPIRARTKTPPICVLRCNQPYHAFKMTLSGSPNTKSPIDRAFLRTPPICVFQRTPPICVFLRTPPICVFQRTPPICVFRWTPPNSVLKSPCCSPSN